MSPTRARTRLRGAARVEAACVGALIALAVLGAALVPVTTATCVRALVIAVGADRLTGIGEEATLQAAEAVRIFVLDPDAPSLPENIDGVPAFDEVAVSHLLDVRNVLVPARRLTLALLTIIGAWALIRSRTEPGRLVTGASLRAAAWILVCGTGLGVLAGMADFGALFSWFHGLFFEPGTWVFPDSALLIRVFPLPFWTAAGASWGALVLMSSGVLFIGGRRLCFTRGTYGV